MRADIIDRRVEDAETALRRAIEENSWLLGRIKKLKAAQLEAVEKKAAEAASQAVEDFQASEEYEDKKVEYFVNVYDARKQSIWDRVTAKHSKLDMNFLDEIWDPTVLDVSMIGASASGAVL